MAEALDERDLLAKKITDKIGIVYKAFLTTNGSMLSKELLQKVKFSSIQLTFDGLEKTHDRLRVSDHFHFKEEIELIENIMNFSQAKVPLIPDFPLIQQDMKSKERKEHGLPRIIF